LLQISFCQGSYPMARRSYVQEPFPHSNIPAATRSYPLDPFQRRAAYPEPTRYYSRPYEPPRNYYVPITPARREYPPLEPLRGAPSPVWRRETEFNPYSPSANAVGYPTYMPSAPPPPVIVHLHFYYISLTH
jgi:hypothetical protein